MKARLGFTVLLVIVALALLAVPVVMAEAGAPQPGTVAQTATYTYFPATALTGAGTGFSSAPRQVSGLDITRVSKFNSVDVFVTIDLATTGVVTVTPQFSADQSNWADAAYTVISGTTPAEVTDQLVLSADGSEYISVPIAGEYLRFKIARSASVTPTILATLRNN